jgi:hypothetical protein
MPNSRNSPQIMRTGTHKAISTGCADRDNKIIEATFSDESIADTLVWRRASAKLPGVLTVEREVLRQKGVCLRHFHIRESGNPRKSFSGGRSHAGKLRERATDERANKRGPGFAEFDVAPQSSIALNPFVN